MNNKITFCPHLIMDMPNATPEEIEEYLHDHFLTFIAEVINQPLEVCFSNALLERFESFYPWDKSTDPEWRGYVSQWHGLICSKLSRVTLISHEMEGYDVNYINNCASISEGTNAIFNGFLSEIATKTLPQQKNEEAIFIPEPSCQGCHDFILIKNNAELKRAIHTWYKFYPLDLPCAGNFPFIPPINWRNSAQPRRGLGHGYLDNLNREWKKDTFHGDHWDVQDEYQGHDRYTNVNYDGDILS